MSNPEIGSTEEMGIHFTEPKQPGPEKKPESDAEKALKEEEKQEEIKKLAKVDQKFQGAVDQIEGSMNQESDTELATMPEDQVTEKISQQITEMGKIVSEPLDFGIEIKDVTGIKKEYWETYEKIKDLQPDLKKAIEENYDLIKQGKYDQAYKNTAGILEKIKDQVPPEQQEAVKKLLTDKAFQEEIKESIEKNIGKIGELTKKENLIKLLSMGADFIPIAGPLKMLTEAAVGKTLDGRVLTLKEKLAYGAEGGLFLILDLIPGATAVKVGKQGIGKLLTRGAAYLRKLGVGKTFVKPIFNTGRFIIKNSKLFSFANKAVAKIIDGKKMMRVKDAASEMLKPKGVRLEVTPARPATETTKTESDESAQVVA